MKRLEADAPREPLSWDPVLSKDGKVFCAPACGFNCTRAAFERARSASEKLASQLGHDWVPTHHENLGWHASATHASKHARVTVDLLYKSADKQTYTAFVNDREVPGGRWLASSEDPLEALQAALAAAQAEANSIIAAIVAVTGGKPL